MKGDAVPRANFYQCRRCGTMVFRARHWMVRVGIQLYEAQPRDYSGYKMKVSEDGQIDVSSYVTSEPRKGTTCYRVHKCTQANIEAWRLHLAHMPEKPRELTPVSGESILSPMSKMQNPLPERVITLDMDGTLFDPWACCGHSDHSGRGKPTCNHIRKDTVKRVRHLGTLKDARFVVLSWRGGLAKATKEWLDSINLPVTHIFVPHSEDTRALGIDRNPGQAAFKASVVRALIAQGVDVVGSFEDNAEVCAALKAAGSKKVVNVQHLVTVINGRVVQPDRGGDLYNDPDPTPPPMDPGPLARVLAKRLKDRGEQGPWILQEDGTIKEAAYARALRRDVVRIPDNPKLPWKPSDAMACYGD